jgi:hypothetical protein
MYRSVKSFLFVACWLLFGCHGLASDSKEGKVPASNGGLVFRVLGGQEHVAVQGAALVLVDKMGGIETLARTDDLGRAVVPKARLMAGRVLLFCRDGYFCGALQLYDKEYKYLDYDELFITLSPFSLP